MRVKLTGLISAFALIATFSLALVSPGAVSAAPGGGAVVTQDSFSFGDCFDYGDGYSLCYSDSGTYHSTQTPSGNYIYRENGTYTYTLSYNGVVVKQYTSSHKSQSAVTENNAEYHSGYTDSFTYDGYTFCVSESYHYTNGQIQFDRVSYSC